MSNAKDSYISVTAHFITDNWTKVNLTLGCEPLSECHTAQILHDKILNILSKFDIKTENVICIVMDNAAANNLLGDLLPFPWMGCHAHLLQLISQIPFQRANTSNTVKKVREIVNRFSYSHLSRTALESMQITLGVEKPLAVVQEVSTRWWSTFEMISRILTLSPALKGMMGGGMLDIQLDATEWEELIVLQQLLEPFRDSQLCLEGNYPTSSYIPVTVLLLREHLNSKINYFQSTGPVVETEKALFNKIKEPILHCANLMKEKLIEKYGTGLENTVFWEHLTRGYRQIRKGLPLPAMIAAATNPKTKSLQGIPDADKNFVWDAVKEEMMKIHFDVSEAVTENQIEDTDFDDADFSFLDSYLSSYQPQETSDLSLTKEKKIELEIATFRELPIGKTNMYLWWSINEVSFPYLSLVARKFQAVPATSAASERVFSSGGDIVTPCRSSLRPEIVNHLVLIKGSLQIVEELKSNESRKRKFG